MHQKLFCSQLNIGEVILILMVWTLSTVRVHISTPDSPNSDPLDEGIEIDLNGRDGTVLEEPRGVIEILRVLGAIGSIIEGLTFCLRLSSATCGKSCMKLS